MGFNKITTELSLTAKLTPIGRQKMVSNNNALIKSFSLGDSDANYYVNSLLESGEIPSLGGEEGANGTVSNGTNSLVSMRSTLVLNTSGEVRKPVSLQSSTVLAETSYNGVQTATGSDLKQFKVDRNDTNVLTNSKVNLFYSFGLPLNAEDDLRYTTTIYSKGGFSDTALASLAQTDIAIIAIDNDLYGECIDGKSLKVTIGTYDLFGTYQNGVKRKEELDVLTSDKSYDTGEYGNNIVYLFCDDIARPNSDPSLSWSTGFQMNRPFSINGKETFNLQNNSNLGLVQDVMVGIAYLDKGIIVITNPTIFATFNIGTPAIVEYNSVSTSVFQNITCIADRGEFGSTTNPTFTDNDVPRISEVFLYDEFGNVIAVAKSDRHITKNVNEFLALGIKIII